MVGVAVQTHTDNGNTSKPRCREPHEIYIVGTSHVSEESAVDVARAINAIRPDAVIVELCKGRSAVLYQDQGTAVQAKRASQPVSMTGAASIPTAAVCTSLQSAVHTSSLQHGTLCIALTACFALL
jgi:TraB/PrgY/gumN family